MKNFIDTIQEPLYIWASKQNCKIKDNALHFNIFFAPENLKFRTIKKIANLKIIFNTYFNIPINVKSVRISEHFANSTHKNYKLNANIVTQTARYRNRQVIIVKTNIASVFLSKIK